MGLLGSIAGPVLGNVVGGVLDIFGGYQQHEWMKDAADKSMAFSERMSSTAWQRGVADMRKAGLNPMLAFSQGPASAPTGDTITPPNVFERVASNVMGLARLRNEVKLMEQNISESESRVRLQEAQADAARSSARLTDADFYPKAKVNEFLDENPWYIPFMKGMEAVGSGFSSARDAALMYRGIKGFGDGEGRIPGKWKPKDKR